MKTLLKRLWWLVTAPFRLLYWLVALPFRGIRRFNKFMNDVPDENSLADAFVNAVQSGGGLIEHFEALRRNLLRALVFLALTTTVSFVFSEQLIAFLAVPAGGLDTLKAIDVTETISVFMKVSFLLGIIFALPYIVFETWLFVAPGLMPASRRRGLLAIPFATLFFVAGVAFAYFVMLPNALPFLQEFLGIRSEWRPASYFSFVTGLMFWLGVAFEFPLVVYILSAMGILQPKVLASQGRLAIIIIAVIAAAITPTVDPVNMALVMVPLIILYFLSIGLSFIAYGARRRKEPKA
jgi:sec-independent protein translocase protein TatC